VIIFVNGLRNSTMLQ